jgi:hypothetical protein
MAKNQYSAEFKAKVALEAIQSRKTVNKMDKSQANLTGELYHSMFKFFKIGG